MSTLFLTPEDIAAMTALSDMLVKKNQTIADQKSEIDVLRKELMEEKARNRAAVQALAGPSTPAQDMPTINLPTLDPEEFAPASSQPSGPHRHVSPLNTNGSRNPLADSFVL